jgi:putative transposase
MPRPLRPIDDGLIYHVINRGNNRQDVFHKPADFQAFLMALAEERKPFDLYGYCLLSWENGSAGKTGQNYLIWLAEIFVA